MSKTTPCVKKPWKQEEKIEVFYQDKKVYEGTQSGLDALLRRIYNKLAPPSKRGRR